MEVKGSMPAITWEQHTHRDSQALNTGWDDDGQSSNDQSSRPYGLLALPDEMLNQVLQFLKISEICSLEQTCTLLRKKISSLGIWKQRLLLINQEHDFSIINELVRLIDHKYHRNQNLYKVVMGMLINLNLHIRVMIGARQKLMGKALLNIENFTCLDNAKDLFAELLMINIIDAKLYQILALRDRFSVAPEASGFQCPLDTLRRFQPKGKRKLIALLESTDSNEERIKLFSSSIVKRMRFDFFPKGVALLEISTMAKRVIRQIETLICPDKIPMTEAQQRKLGENLSKVLSGCSHENKTYMDDWEKSHTSTLKAVIGVTQNELKQIEKSYFAV